jgi:hypothetical protein
VSDAPFSLGARPPSEVEWEELLVRLEITPRALRLAVEDAGGDSPELRAVLRAAMGVELWWSEALQQLRDARPVQVNAAMPHFDAGGREPNAGELALGFAELRERNFAQVQRRGLGVWDWKSDVVGRQETLTAYQLLQWIALRDRELLAWIRGARTGGR